MKYILKELFGIDTLPSDDDKEAHISILQKSMIELEGFYHGKTSGIDIKTVIRGGLCYFTDNLKTCNTINLWKNEDSPREDESSTIRLILIDTGVQGSTKEAVSMVKKYLDTLSESEAESKMTEIGEITQLIKKELESPKFNLRKDLGDLIEKNHQKLNNLGICKDSNNKIVRYFHLID